MKPPCEIVVWYVIPSIRSKLAKDLLSLGMKQKEISELLDITQPAVSQYISDKRGDELEFTPEVNEYIMNMAVEMQSGKLKSIDLIPRFCHICKTIKTQEVLCQLHKEKVGVPTECTVCMETDIESSTHDS